MSDAIPTDPLFGVMIEDCFVFGWRMEEDSLVVDLLFSLWPGNPNYDEPNQGDWTCYKKGKLVVRRAEILEGLRSMSDVETTTDPDGSIDYGELDSALIIGDIIEIWGPFGGVRTKVQDVSYTLERSAGT